MSGFRIEGAGHVDRARPLRFTFDGKAYSGFSGDTLASALIANGVKIVGRSFKYHRPRGIMTAGLDEPNAIVRLGEGGHATPNLKATGVELFEGLRAHSVNAWPSVKFDVLSVNSLLSRFLPAGFYYKTFMWPDWHWFEPFIRKAAGLGESPSAPDVDAYDKRFCACDIMVIGGGPAGLIAALTAGRSGARVMLVESDFEWGAAASAAAPGESGERLRRWIDSAVEELSSLENVTLLNRTMAFGYYDHNFVALIERCTDHLPTDRRSGPRQRMWKVRAKKVILATGAFERPLAFPNNDRPGVMLANAALVFARRFGAAPGRRVALATNNDSAYRTALALRALGLDIVMIADARGQPRGEAIDRAKAAGVHVMTSASASDVRGAKGVRQVAFHKIDDLGRARPGEKEVVACDCLLTSGGWSPAVHLFSQSGGKIAFDNDLQAFTPQRSLQDEQSVGAAAGAFEMKRALDEASRSAVRAAEALGFSAEAAETPCTDNEGLGEVRALWSVDVAPLGRKGAKAWLDFQNDVTVSDVKLALRENFASVEHVKRYTTLGMATDQGKTSNVNAIGVMRDVMAKPVGEIGVTKFRPPFDPVPIGAFAGRRLGDNLSPLRALAAEARHQSLGARMEDYGGWRRPACYLRGEESESAAVARETQAVRQGVGLFEASPLGKIEVAGPDAAEFLNRIYVNNVAALKPGRCRYGLMLNEHGVVIDDGVLACRAKNHFIVGATSGGAAGVAETLQEWLQCEWPQLDVVTEDVTTGWAVMNVNGPQARPVLEKLNCDIDLSPDAFPHMHMREGALEGVRCRMQRVSFTGELSYEVAVPWDCGAALYDALLEAGEEFAIAPFGIESLMTLRIEKGFLHVGADTDGVTMPQDVGFGPLIEKKKGDFVGRRSTMRPDARRRDRRQFVGLEASDGGGALPVGAHVIAMGEAAPTTTQGWVSSSAYSHTLGRPVALGLVANGRARMGEEVQIWNLGEARRARIAPPGAVDPDGERLHV